MSELENNTDDQAIIQAILGLADNLNINIIAEGIENAAQQNFLLAHNCAFGQGYLFERPQSVESFIDKINK